MRETVTQELEREDAEAEAPRLDVVGFEQILLRLERALSLPERIGAAWHRSLLFDARAPIAGFRPAIFPAPAEQTGRSCWGSGTSSATRTPRISTPHASDETSSF
ncbi:MAG: hypothetical protein IT377_07405 [Polyangiaceae bacterium]|nr:hypothetical protein [Polyangiaceae bacterium]